MSLRSPSLPFLPGYGFNPNIGREKFNRNPYFETIGGTQMLVPKSHTVSSKINPRYPSLYTRGEVSELPGWIAFDKQVLTFDCFYQESLHEFPNSTFQLHFCKLYFYLEDGTIRLVEPKTENSGTVQGTIISRQKINLPPPKDHLFFDIIDLNVGKEIELFGKVIKLINCDQFTRSFINRLGIGVPDAINPPKDPYIIMRKKLRQEVFPKKPNSKIDTFGKFLAYDRKVLRFFGQWDDRATVGGYIHNLTINYYLMDDTFEITEVVRENSGKDSGSTFIKRGKLPKFYTELPTPGYYDNTTILNVLGPNVMESRYVIDPLNCGKSKTDFYTYPDLSIGAAINIYGRKVVLTGCDPYTREFYRKKYGIDHFTTEVKSKEPVDESVPLHKRKLPPWNGYGSFEDSAQNCTTVQLKPLMKDFKQFLKLDRDGMDSRVLRFKAVLKSLIPANCIRNFVIYYYLADNTIAIFELAGTKSGGCFLTRGPIRMPGQKKFTSEPPDYYQPQHMFIGATLIINSFTFILVDADEYAYRYMELHCKEFPKSDIELVLNKVREKLKPIYTDFLAKNIPTGHPVIPFEDLRKQLCPIMGDDWTEHEMITLARSFSGVCRTERHSRSFIRQIVLTELKKMLWDDLERLKEIFRAYDDMHTGFLPRKEVYTMMRACRIPLDKLIIEQMLNVLQKNDKCEIDGNDLFCFMDRNYCPCSDLVPLNVKRECWWASEPDPVSGKLIDWCALQKALNLDYLLKVVVRPKQKIEE